MGFRDLARVVWIALISIVSTLISLPEVAAGDASSLPGDQIDFDREIAPILAVRCLSCHSVSEKKSGLDLSSREGFDRGSENGAVFEPGKLDESELWIKVSQDQMPPKKPLGAAEKAVLKKWLENGAKWGTSPIDPFRFTTVNRAGYDWWSLQPLKAPAVPNVRQLDWVKTEIDNFILQQLEARGLQPAGEADRRTLIRRLSFDLRGLPPNSVEVAQFLSDKSPDAYEKLVQQYLDSPAYGERWARHWLDLARFGESQGFERDKLRPNSWRYRDWVVWALNRDLPYDVFALWQIAGDVVSPDDPMSQLATGYLVSAPWDEVGQSQQSAAMRAVVRQDELEDVIGTVCQTFLGLTANCARCHDHKFDPISQKTYYQLAAALSGVRHGERETLTGRGRENAIVRRESLEIRRTELLRSLQELERPIRVELERELLRHPNASVTVPQPIAKWDFDEDLRDQIGELHGTAHGPAKVEQGKLILKGIGSFVTTPPLVQSLKAKTLEAWVKLSDLKQQGGGVISVQFVDGSVFDSLVFAEREIAKWLPGSNGFVRSVDLEGAEQESLAHRDFVHVAITYADDLTVTCYRQGRMYGKPYKASSLPTFEAGKSQVLFGLRHSPTGGNRLLTGEIDRASLYDKALSAEEIAASAGVKLDKVQEITSQEIFSRMPSSLRRQWCELVSKLTQIEAEQRLLSGGPAYIASPRQPEATHLLLRGNPATPGDEVSAGAIPAVHGLNPDFDLPVNAPESDRRLRLARWITNPSNPLTPRVIANRLWHYHFGVGIVETPNDFGFNGSRPSHPELLDYLATYIVRNGWSLKALHRLIVTSATYRQSSRYHEGAHALDAENRLLWRKTPLRLEAEAVRDAVLSVAGELNPTMGGPGFQDFTTFTANSQFYEMIDPVGFAFQRRSLYRTWVRSGRNSMLDVLDCPDPSTTAPKRAVTTTPLQALSLLNNSFMLRMSDRLAKNIETYGTLSTAKKIELTYQQVLQRDPTEAEVSKGGKFVDQFGLAAFCRVLFNSNEFLYID